MMMKRFEYAPFGMGTPWKRLYTGKVVAGECERSSDGMTYRVTVPIELQGPLRRRRVGLRRWWKYRGHKNS